MLIIIRIIVTVLFCIFGFSLTCVAVSVPSVSAASAVVIDGDTNEILFEKDPYQSRSMASTTKIMTALLAVESGKLNETVKIEKPPNIEGTAIGFSSGDAVSLETLCYGMLLESGNDAAVVTSEFLAGTEAQFSKLMNKKAREIGMKHTNFVTASGLDDDQHYTTAYDMALLGSYAVKNEKFAEICSTKTYKASFITPGVTRSFYNHNRLLGACDGVFGIKTGFTKKSGRCLVTACKRGDKLLVAVTLNAPDDWNDHKKMYEYAYSLYSQRLPEINLPECVDVIGSVKTDIKISFSNKPLTLIKDSELNTIVYISKNIYAPIQKNDIIGSVGYFSGDRFIVSVPVLSAENATIHPDAEIYKPSFIEWLSEFFSELFKV